MVKYPTCIFFLLVSWGCGNIPGDVKQVLELSGDNRLELQAVIDHYQEPEDSLKLQAAYFLIRNMTNKYSLEGKQLEQYNTIFSTINKLEARSPLQRGINRKNRFPKVDSLWSSIAKKYGPLYRSILKVTPDLYTISGDFLIENIEYAFKAWSLPWCNHLSFEEFCEYILPYRFSDESLTAWRPLIFKKYGDLIDSLKTTNDPVAVCDSVNKDLMSWWRYSHTFMQYPVAMIAENLLLGKMGVCSHQAGLGVLVMRALGVPVVHETIPHYGNRSLGHDFNGVLSKEGKFIDFEGGQSLAGNVINKPTRSESLIPKIYRRNYSTNENSLAIKKSEQEQVPPFFQSPNIVDVTANYIPVADVRVQLFLPAPGNTDHAYLCIFNNKEWKSVSWAKIKDGEAVFTDMGKGIVYMPMYYYNDALTPAAYPLILNDNGTAHSIVPCTKAQDMVIKRKYTSRARFKTLMMDGRFQAANSRDFRDAVTLLHIRDTIDLVYQNILFNGKRTYRYVRYLMPQHGKGDIAEMSFISEKNEELSGQILTSENIRRNATVPLAFDGDVLSYVSTTEKQQEQWIGLDFGLKKNISKLRFCPRTDKNNVWQGLTYEMFYWDRKWKSLGIQKATSDSLVYKSPVSEALYLVRCLDEGKEERIFTYSNGKQIWW